MQYSIVIPYYNAHKFIHDTLSSIFNQTVAPKEIIIVDDGSTETEAVQVLKELAQIPRVIVLHQEKSGPASARNTGIENATADYILPLDSDDVIAPDYGRLALEQFKLMPDSVVYGRAEFFGRKTGAWNLPPYSPGRLLFENMIYVAAFYPRAAWEKVGGYDVQLTDGREDHEFWIRMILGLGLPVVQLEPVVFYYRQHDGGVNKAIGSNRKRLSSTYAEIFRRNAPIYANHAELVVEEYLKMVDRINDYNNRYGRLERRLLGNGLLARVYQILRASRRLSKGRRKQRVNE
ncbi:glycosyltransferase [Micrococcus luteus]|nr:glycosyltransferase [Micrococcus luteus]